MTAGTERTLTVAEGQPRGVAPPRLVIVEGDVARVCDLHDGTATLGRAPSCELPIDDASISREHVRLTIENGAVTARDLGSRNGTRHNGQPLVGEVLLRNGDVLSIGAVQVTLLTAMEAETSPSSSQSTPEHAESALPRILRTPRSEVLLVGSALRSAYSALARLSRTSLSLLITGETGVGKEAAAAFVHARSARSDGPFVSVSGASIGDGLAESELFGHARGAFTGAQTDRVGLYEAAHEGTLFLDEVAELSLGVQAKLLRALETRTFRRLGEVRARNADVRLVAATHIDLTREVEAGRFRRDLYFRLAGATIALPPLRALEDAPGDGESRDGIEELARHLVGGLARSLGRSRTPELSADAVRRLRAHTWPGNARELRNALEYALSFDHDTIEADDLPTTIAAPPRATVPPPAPMGASPKPSAGGGVVDELRGIERARIEAALAASGGNKTRAAQQLGMPVRTLSEKLRRWARTPSTDDENGG